jgi:predicted nucleotidyltransferase
MSGVVFRRLDRDLVVERLGAWAADELAARPDVREAILIGSLARGDWSARSDADVVIVVDRATAPGPFRSPAYLPRRSVGVPVDILVYTSEEVLAWSDRFRAEVSRGIVLYRRPGPARAGEGAQ